VLAVASEITGDSERAALLLCHEPLRALGYKTADTSVQEDRSAALIAYLESLAGAVTAEIP
jgi:hypothetical protein